jgi:hypothetical protein
MQALLKKASMKTKKGKRELIPRWEMPSDPVKAVFWFVQWLLIVLVRFFWIPIIGMMIYEAAINSPVGGVTHGLISGAITLFIGLCVWGLLYLLLLLAKFSNAIAQTIIEVNRMQQGFMGRNRHSSSPFFTTEQEENVVEGTVTNLEEERRKRRQYE